MSDKTDPTAAPISAEALRMSILEKEMEKMDGERKAREAEQKKLAAFTEDFLHKHVSDGRDRRWSAAWSTERGQGRQDGGDGLQLPVGRSAPTAGGRSTTARPNWPETLQGKAKELYDRYETLAKPQGYRLKAMIINFPGGVPGDVGFFLNWAPPAVWTTACRRPLSRAKAGSSH